MLDLQSHHRIRQACAGSRACSTGLLVVVEQALASQDNGSAPGHQDGAQDEATARGGGVAQAGLHEHTVSTAAAQPGGD